MSQSTNKDIILNKTLRVLVEQNALTPEEVTQLRLSHLHLAGKTPSISFTPSGSQETKVVTLDMETHRALVSWLVNRPDSTGDFLFPGANEGAMDPAEVRRKNFIAANKFPFQTQMGAVYDSGDYAKALDAALLHAKWNELKKERDAESRPRRQKR